jgi:hypothetical protein
MKALTLHRPWPMLIMKHGKNIENRSWKPPLSLIGHRLAIHAGQKVDGAGIVRAMEILKGDKVTYAHDAQALCGPPGVIVGTVVVRGWVRGYAGFGMLTAADIVLANTSPWLSGPYGWVLEDPRSLREPIPCKGAQRLWTVPGAIEEEIRGQL